LHQDLYNYEIFEDHQQNMLRDLNYYQKTITKSKGYK